MMMGLPVLLEEIPYVDFPELKLDEHESTEMPFRYVKGEDGGPVMPAVCIVAHGHLVPDERVMTDCKE